VGAEQCRLCTLRSTPSHCWVAEDEVSAARLLTAITAACSRCELRDAQGQSSGDASPKFTPHRLLRQPTPCPLASRPPSSRPAWPWSASRSSHATHPPPPAMDFPTRCVENASSACSWQRRQQEACCWMDARRSSSLLAPPRGLITENAGRPRRGHDGAPWIPSTAGRSALYAI
jgi:hypothetical protein